MYKVEFPLATGLESTLNEYKELGWTVVNIFPPLDSGGRFVVIFSLARTTFRAIRSERAS